MLHDTFVVSSDGLDEETIERRRRIVTIISIATSAAIGNTVSSVARVPYEVIMKISIF